ncbi:site-specific DNA-methyltransferase [Clostridiales Family XIII bacterium ASD5510]|uniref:Methyltransferase n=1 Tax=Hominibacterium faecale TaxID=2839743 RepID=A0A9J6QZE6_9FIRM|nr:site-specific DNA-methyltransferase [Hominibacterium faecale]MCU7380839.1 site-specific DNA-methyltransferase [Hominibacterium faecale]
MKRIADQSIDLILCDLPYGVTSCKWDTVIPLGSLWEQYKRIIKPRGVIALTAIQPFTTQLINSNRKMFRYCWYWIKNQVTGFPFAKKQPLRCVEDVVVFYKQAPTYNPQGLVRIDKGTRNGSSKARVYRSGLDKNTLSYYKNYPRQTLNFKCQRDGLHPTQKPVALFEYIIRTYTNEGAVVLDNCIGSGTTAVACINANRNFIGFEIDQKYYQTAIGRIESLSSKL